MWGAVSKTLISKGANWNEVSGQIGVKQIQQLIQKVELDK
jgi:hypothetical protein